MRTEHLETGLNLMDYEYADAIAVSMASGWPENLLEWFEPADLESAIIGDQVLATDEVDMWALEIGGEEFLLVSYSAGGTELWNKEYAGHLVSSDDRQQKKMAIRALRYFRAIERGQ